MPCKRTYLLRKYRGSSLSLRIFATSYSNDGSSEPIGEYDGYARTAACTRSSSEALLLCPLVSGRATYPSHCFLVPTHPGFVQFRMVQSSEYEFCMAGIMSNVTR